MNETTHTLMRVIALAAATVLFAGLWSNDQPNRTLALKNQPVPHNLVQTEPEWVPMEESQIEVAHSTPPAQTISRQITISTCSKSFEIDSSDLLIAEPVLQRHLDQLPLGLPAGDYRIVDSLGGVGWLRVRMEGSSSPSPNGQQIYSTAVDDQEVRFVRIARTARKPAAVTANR